MKTSMLGLAMMTVLAFAQYSHASLLLTINGTAAVPTEPGGIDYQMDWNDYFGLTAGGEYDELDIGVYIYENIHGWDASQLVVGDDITYIFRGAFLYAPPENGEFPDLVFDNLRVTPYPDPPRVGLLHVYTMEPGFIKDELIARIEVVPEPASCIFLGAGLFCALRR